MPEHNRRSILRNTAFTAAGLAAGNTFGSGVAAAGESVTECDPPLGPVTVKPADLQYQDLVRRGNNKRYIGTPDYVRVVGSTEQVVRAVQDAVDSGKRIAVRGGGHCLENFVDDPAIEVVIDLSGMTDVYFDRSCHAFVAEGGAILGEVYRRLFLGWGVTLPSGWCPGVGVGGHVSVGGYGVLSRTYGLSVDHLYAVEVVVVDRAGRARAVVATRDPADPHHDLWWAHTGGGGGNFGVVTRYWLRTPGVSSNEPEKLLPRPPAAVLDFSGEWSWEGMDEQKFTRLMENHGRWCERNTAPGTPTAPLYAELIFHRRAEGRHTLVGQVYGPDAERLLDDYIATVSEGVAPPSKLVRTWAPWLETALGGPDDTELFRFKIKSAYLRNRFTDRQAATIYRKLIADQPGDLLLGTVGLSTYGGRINAVAPAATASATRDAIIKLTYVAAWADPAQDAQHDAWIRDLYRAVYADTGGVPDPRDGAYMGYPDRDLADPEQNTSGVHWTTLYYKDNYPRLQRVKARWDPRNEFRHALSISTDAP
ncbi:FAD-binding oxidoreductase [Amycolatopsis aidingensis]|uniref:FAD-binding oxidoreductase n=1 Tax=Amycolatopsis aidingensis TaxID=2842453 RepID=UPI001C0B7AB8|nr:FAD-binding protein [Amycolatopsis aidingensis]